ncbi:unnamed protein product [Porites lobata]|uniref:SEA domain-containing protein n=1 Tax=Porites lobata TaxID=104759 RepID=A0ABN8MRY9_9CNID|nr:unnamed protein product [Porites lobata]
MLQDKSVARFYCPFHRTPVAFVDDEYWLSINPGGEVNPPKYLYEYSILYYFNVLGSVYNLTLKLTNATYTDDLANPHSAKFIKLRTDFEVGIMQVYDGYKPFVGVTTLRFSKAPDGKSIVHFCVEFTTNGTHLPNLTKAITLGKLGKLTPVSVAPKLDQAACYKEPAPPVCPIPCPSACAPSCYDTCCQQGYPMGYQQPYYMPPPPPVPVPVPVAGTCPNSCPNTCAPVGCTPACCNTVYNPAPYQYGKRHHAPRPVKGAKKHHIFHKLHRKN